MFARWNRIICVIIEFNVTTTFLNPKNIAKFEISTMNTLEIDMQHVLLSKNENTPTTIHNLKITLTVQNRIFSSTKYNNKTFIYGTYYISN